MLQPRRHRAGLYRSGLERDVLCIGDLINEKVFAALIAFFGTIGTSDYQPYLVDGDFCILRAEPLADGWRELQLPRVLFVGHLDHLALGDVLVPLRGYELPSPFAHHADMHVDIARVTR